MKALEGLNAALAEKKVRVVAKGERAYTDGNTVYIPYLGDTLSKEQETLIAGYNDHESEHVIDSSFSIINEAHQEGGQRLATMLNIVEDIRIENRRAKRYAGAYKNLQALSTEVFNKPVSDAINQLLYEGRRQVIGFKYDCPVVADNVKDYFGADVFDRIAAAQNSADALEIARDLLGKHNDNLEQQKQEQSQEGESEQQECQEGNGQESNDDPGEWDSNDDGGDDSDTEGADFGDGQEPGDDGEAEGQGGNPLDGVEDDSDGIAANDAAGDDGEQAEAEGAGEGDDGEGGQTEGDMTRDDGDNEYSPSDNTVETEDALDNFQDPMAKMRDKLAEWHENFVDSGEYNPWSTEQDEVIVVEPADDLSQYNQRRAELGNLNSVRARIVKMFKTRTARRWYSGQESGRLDSRLLASVKGGNSRVFKRRTECDDVDTAVTFVIDNSISMSGSPLQEAVKATILLMETLDGAGMATEVTGFTTKGRPDEVKYGDHNNYDCCNGVIDYIYKAFSEPFNSRVKRRIGNAENQTKGNTNDFTGLRFAYRRIQKRRERRKIIIMLCDGDTGVYGNTPSLKRKMRKQVEDVQKSGVELLAFGLYDDSVKQYYKNHVVVNYNDSLSAKVLEGLQKILNV